MSLLIHSAGLLLLAGRMAGLRAMVCLSSVNVNVNLPPGASVDEAIYPLHFGSQEVRGGWALGGEERCTRVSHFLAKQISTHARTRMQCAPHISHACTPT